MKVLLVEDHALFRDGVTLILENLEEDVNVVCAESAAQALSLAEQHADLALILLDYNLPDGNGLDIIATLQDRGCTTPMIMLSAEQNSDLIHQTLNNGAKGFITKSSPSAVMISAIKLVLAGGIYIPPDALSKPANAKVEAESADESADNRKTTNSNSALTERQRDVLLEMHKGLSNKEIARELNMSPSTVKVHVAAILREFNVKNRTQAVTFAKERGLIGND